MLAIGAERDTANASVVPDQGKRFLPRFSLQRCGVPDADRAVVTRRDESRPVWTKVYAPHPFAMAAESENFLSGLEVPELHGFVHACGGKALTVWTEFRAMDDAGMAAHAPDQLAGPGVPDMNLPVGVRANISSSRGQP